jgi:hypothetical protein
MPRPSSRGAPREHLDAVVLLGEVEQAVGQVGDHRALVDQQPVEDRVALALERARPPTRNLRGSATTPLPIARWGSRARPPGGQQVQLEPGGGVARRWRRR